MDLVTFRLKFNRLSQFLGVEDADVEVLVDGKPLKEICFRIRRDCGVVDLLSKGETDESID